MNKSLRQRFERLSAQPLVSFSLLHGGFNNATYQVNDTFVFRAKKPSDQAFYSPSGEGKILRAASSFGLTPTLFAFDEEKGDLLDAYIDNDRTFLKQTPSEEHIRHLALLLRTLHSIPGDFPSFKVDERYAYYRAHSDVTLGGEEESDIVTKAHSILQNSPQKLCHNDLVKGNFLLDPAGRIYLIDFEFAGLNNPLFDLASFLSENLLFAEPLIRFFLSAYYGYPPTRENLGELKAIIAYENYLWFYWARERYLATKKPIFLRISRMKKREMILTQKLFLSESTL